MSYWRQRPWWRAAAHAENEATRAEVFARLPQSVGNIRVDAGQSADLQPSPIRQPGRPRSAADLADDVRALPECGMEYAAKGHGPVPRQRAGPAIRRERHCMDHRHGLPDATSCRSWLAGTREPTSSNASTTCPSLRPVNGSQPQDIVIDQKNRKFHIADENIGPGGDGSHAAIIVIDMDTGLRAARAGRRSVDRSGECADHGGWQRSDRAGQGRQAPIIKVGCDGITMDVPLRIGLLRAAQRPFRSTASRPPTSATTSSSPEELSARVERYWDKPEQWRPLDPLCRQHLPDRGGNEVDRHTIGTDRKYSTYLSHPAWCGPMASRPRPTATCMCRRPRSRRGCSRRKSGKQDAVSDLSLQAGSRWDTCRGEEIRQASAGAKFPVRPFRACPPGAPAPGIDTHDGGYGFRARRFARPE